MKKQIADTDIEIWYGHHGSHFHAGDPIEPAVAIFKNGEPIADASVYNSLINAAEPAQTVSAEVSTVYEPETEEEIAHFAQGELTIPADTKQCAIRFRVEIPGQPEQTADVRIDL